MAIPFLVPNSSRTDRTLSKQFDKEAGRCWVLESSSVEGYP